MISSSSTSKMVTIMLWFVLWATSVNLSMSDRCNERDQHVLSIFKHSLRDPWKLLSSWSNKEDCCKWIGVECDNITGRVTKLDLHCSYYDLYDHNDEKCLGGEINFDILLELEFLSFLDLSNNLFETIRLPALVHGSANSQRPQNSSLDTSQHGRFTNFSSLIYLDLSQNYYLHMDNLAWLSHLSSLKYLNLSGVSLEKETNWLQLMTMLPSLSELRLSFCGLYGLNASLGYVNFTSLQVLDLSSNFIVSEIPEWLSKLNTSISYLDLSSNNLQGEMPKSMLNLRHMKSLLLAYNNLNGSIPEWIGQYKHLDHLDLSNNKFSGPIPSTLGNLSSLTYLDIRSNQLNGSLPIDLGYLSKLEILRVGHNSLTGVLSKESFSKLSNLKYIDLDSSAVSANLDSHWRAPFQLESLSMRSCMLGPDFPSWIYGQRSLDYLDLSSSGLSFSAQDKFWNFVSRIDYLFLTNNSISGEISTLLINNTSFDLGSNNFEGMLPHLSSKVAFFNIAYNNFSGPISPLLCQTMNGKQKLAVLDLSHNLLSGELPDCWMHWRSLLHVNLGSNNLTGEIPHSIGSLLKLQTLSLRNNSLFGSIPPSLQNSNHLWFLDLAMNELSGNIPRWTNNLTMILILRSNKLSGHIPAHTCQLQNLRVLDLADNRLSGPIPNCLNNMTPMVTNNINEELFISFYYQWEMPSIALTNYWNEDLLLFVKGRESDYWNILNLVRVVDLSSNELSGLIPTEIFSLVALNSLNLSHNHLIGSIPNNIGNLKLLESLDLSNNQLSGEIPQNLSELSFLNHLDLSYNNFSGRIPLGTQLQSFNASSYIGNPELCGAPLEKNCTQEELTPTGGNDDDDDDFTSYFYIGMGVGFAFGFWGVCSLIFFVRAVRHAYFQWIYNMTGRVFGK